MLLGALGAGVPPTTHAQDAPDTVYTQTNATAQAGGNQIAIYRRAADGSLVLAGTAATGGAGTGAGLGSQGAVVLSENLRWLFAVNAGSDQVSAFAVTPDGLRRTDTVASGGTMPISLTTDGDRLYVLNAGSNTIAGFDLRGGRLSPIAGAVRPLSAGAAGAAQIQFRPDGRVLVVTEKTSNTIDTFVVDRDGRAGPAQAHAAAVTGATPFGFAFARRDLAIVSDAGIGALSAYDVDTDGSLQTRTAAAYNGQEAPCWVVATQNGAFAYTTNAHSGTISGYRIDHDGQLRLLTPGGVTADTGAGSGPTDMALSNDGRVLYALTEGTRSISAFRIAADGRLTAQPGATGIPAGMVGLAAR
ncbi:MAG TPA: beta-propeller fold lactonase family protein [Dehalococcoidia bacterium]|nr:beta-propeller fold lactonase family protein [Dehalococcoidia bacterium]